MKQSLLVRTLLLWILFFLICFGLGYPILNRYDPRISGGNTDSREYSELVQSRPHKVGGYWRYRVLVPSVAKPFYQLARDRVGSWDPVLFGLLVASALFCATTACLLMKVGYQVVGQYPVGLLSALLYLLNFTVPNGQLSGLVDSGEACLGMAVIWALLANKWWLVPIFSIFGTLAKETFLPIGVTFASVWWLVAFYEKRCRFSQVSWVAAMGLTGLVALAMLHSAILGKIVGPWSLEIRQGSFSSLLFNLLKTPSSHEFWYVFIWLLPLGIWRLGSLPRPWVLASAVAALVALTLGAYKGPGVGVRTMFNFAGPVLSLSVAVLLTELRLGVRS